LLRRFQSSRGRQARGLLVLLANEDTFDHALTTALAERMSMRSRPHGPPGIRSFDPKALAFLSARWPCHCRRCSACNSTSRATMACRLAGDSAAHNAPSA
jgi:hypothetical protein